MATIPAPSPEPTAPANAAPPPIALGSGAAGWAEYRLTALGGAGCLALLALAFWPNLRQFVTVWTTDENYSHGFLVPLISLYFAREAARRGPIPVRSGVGPGVTLLALALL